MIFSGNYIQKVRFLLYIDIRIKLWEYTYFYLLNYLVWNMYVNRSYNMTYISTIFYADFIFKNYRIYQKQILINEYINGYKMWDHLTEMYIWRKVFRWIEWAYCRPEKLSGAKTAIGPQIPNYTTLLSGSLLFFYKFSIIEEDCFF